MKKKLWKNECEGMIMRKIVEQRLWSKNSHIGLGGYERKIVKERLWKGNLKTNWKQNVNK